MIRSIIRAANALNDSLVGDAIGVICLFAMGYAFLVLAPALL